MVSKTKNKSITSVEFVSILIVKKMQQFPLIVVTSSGEIGYRIRKAYQWGR